MCLEQIAEDMEETGKEILNDVVKEILQVLKLNLYFGWFLWPSIVSCC